MCKQNNHRSARFHNRESAADPISLFTEEQSDQFPEQQSDQRQFDSFSTRVIGSFKDQL